MRELAQSPTAKWLLMQSVMKSNDVNRGRSRPPTHSARVHSIAPSCHDPPKDELGQLVRCALQQSTDSHDGRSDKDGPATPQRIANKDREHSAQETSQIIGRDRDALVCGTGIGLSFGDAWRLGIDLWEIFGKRWQIHETTSHTLIVAK